MIIRSENIFVVSGAETKNENILNDLHSTSTCHFEVLRRGQMFSMYHQHILLL